MAPRYQQQLAQPRAAPVRPADDHVLARREHPPGLRPSQIPPVDRYEREADQVADATASTARNGLRASLSTLRAGPEGGPAVLPAVLPAGGKPLEGALRGTMQERFGTDFSAVRVHSDGAADRLSEELKAVAFTSGHEIFLGRHATTLAGADRQRLMAHELGHVVQQTAGLSPSRVAAHPAPFVQRMTKQPNDAALAKTRYDEAQTKHNAQSAILREWVEEGRKSPDVLLANSCEWIASDQSLLFAVTPTGDSDDRVRAKGGNPKTEVAYFPRATGNGPEGGDIYHPASATYAYLDLMDNAAVTFQSRDTTGWNTPSITPNKIAAARVPAKKGLGYYFELDARSKSDVLGTLRHEVQHIADRHQGRLDPHKNRLKAPLEEAGVLARLSEAIDKGGGYNGDDLRTLGPATQQAFLSVYGHRHGGQSHDQADQEWWESTITDNSKLVTMFTDPAAMQIYKTEYRAYSYQGNYNKYDNIDDYNEGVQRKFLVDGRQWTDRQYQIFRQIYLGYPSVSRAWDANLTFGGSTFRERVIDYRDPDTEGANKLNSPRIHTVYRELEALPPGVTDQAALGRLLAAIGTLGPDEARYLLNTSEEFSVLLNSAVEDESLLLTVRGRLAERELGK